MFWGWRSIWFNFTTYRPGQFFISAREHFGLYKAFFVLKGFGKYDEHTDVIFQCQLNCNWMIYSKLQVVAPVETPGRECVIA